MAKETAAQRAVRTFAKWQQARRFGEQTRPRALLLGLDKRTQDALSDLFPTFKAARNLGEVDQTEFDLVVTVGRPLLDSLDSLYAIGFGSEKYPHPQVTGEGVQSWPVWFYGTTASKEFAILPEIPDTLIAAVEETLIPLISGRGSNEILAWAAPAQYMTPAAALVVGIRAAHMHELPPPPIEDVIEPFVFTKTGEILAGRYARQGHDAECWCLPKLDLHGVIGWVQTALEVWGEVNPTAFPRHVEWLRNSEWQTPEEESLTHSRDAIRQRRLEELAQIESEEADLGARLTQANVKGDSDSRRLLTGSGRDLVDGVSGVLEDLGFDVEDADESAAAGEFLEDLRLGDRSAKGWTALVEIKGYTKGAKITDLSGFTRLVMRFVDREGHNPDALWYVVNQFRLHNPSTRQRVFHANPPELAHFASIGGLVIDSLDLFRLWRAAKLGELRTDAARELLRTSTGVLSFE